MKVDRANLGEQVSGTLAANPDQCSAVSLVDNVREFNPDCIVLDVMFPGDDGAGFKMARSIRHHDTIKTKPVIMVSGVNEEGNFPGTFTDRDIDDAYLPITAFVDKPVDPKILIEKIESLT